MLLAAIISEFNKGEVSQEVAAPHEQVLPDIEIQSRGFKLDLLELLCRYGAIGQ
jgi:hypothetical protein